MLPSVQIEWKRTAAKRETESNMLIRQKSQKRPFLIRLGKDIKRHYLLYLLILPVAVWYIIFAYVPMAGLQLAFKDYFMREGIWGSPFIGLQNFTRFFSAYNFKNLIWNTISLNIYSLLVGFPIPIIFALLLNYLRQHRLKKTLQMASYAPHFISTVVVCGMISIFMHPDTGVFNMIRALFGLDSIPFLSRPAYFKSIYVWSGVWQGMGWSSIIYISALTGVDYQLHEAAVVEGASKIKRIWHVDLPCIKPTIVMLLILQMGQIMSVGFEKVFLLQNELNFSASDVIATYTYRVGLINNDYGYSTAVGLFNSTINLFTVISVNFLAKKITSESLW